MDFEDIERLEPLREAARRFAEREIAPGVVARDRQRTWDPALLTRMAGAGLLGAMLPTEHGGRGLGALETTALLDGAGEGGEDAGLALAAGVHDFLCAVPLWKLGTEAQRRRYLPRMASGEWVGGLSLLELEGGAATPSLRAEKQGRRWHLHGTKACVVNAPIAHHFLLTAETGPTGGLSAFLVDRETPGLHIGPLAGTPGLRTCLVAELTLEDGEVPEESLLGTEGAALTELLPLQLALERGLLIAPWVGIMRALTRRAVRQARERELFSRPVGRFQSIRMALADMETRCELSTNLLYRTAWQLEHLAQPPRQDAAASRLFISRAAQEVARDALQLHGLRGLEPDLHVERLYRDAMFLTLTGGGSEVLHSVIAGALLKLG